MVSLVLSSLFFSSYENSSNLVMIEIYSSLSVLFDLKMKSKNHYHNYFKVIKEKVWQIK